MFKNTIKNLPGSTIATARILVNAGSFHEKIHGTAHYLEHMIFKGSQLRSSQEINDEISGLGDTNAYTSEDRTLFYITTTKENIKRATEILYEMVFMPLFGASEFEKERNVILEEITARQDSPYIFLEEKTLDKFDGTDHSIVGSKDNIKSMTLSDIENYYYENYTKENIKIIIVGDIGDFNESDLQEIHNKFVKEERSGKFNYTPEFKNDLMSSFENPDILNLEFPMQKNIASVVFKRSSFSESWNNNFVDSVFSNMLGGGMHSLFFKKLRQEMSLCYSCGMSNLNSGLDQYHMAYANLSEENINKCVNAIKGIINNVANGDFDENLVNVSKNNCIFSFAGSLQTPENVCSAIYDNEFSFKESLPNISFEEYNLEAYKNKIKQVTKQDIQNYAKNIVENSSFDVIIVRGIEGESDGK